MQNHFKGIELLLPGRSTAKRGSKLVLPAVVTAFTQTRRMLLDVKVQNKMAQKHKVKYLKNAKQNTSKTQNKY